MKKIPTSVVVLAALTAMLLASCAPGSELELNTPGSTIELTSPGPNPQLDQPAVNGRVAGFVQGLWHGLIAPVSLIGSFFNPEMEMYEVHNNGREYNMGFLIGIAFVFLILGLLGGRGH